MAFLIHNDTLKETFVRSKMNEISIVLNLKINYFQQQFSLKRLPRNNEDRSIKGTVVNLTCPSLTWKVTRRPFEGKSKNLKAPLICCVVLKVLILTVK